MVAYIYLESLGGQTRVQSDNSDYRQLHCQGVYRWN